MTTIATETALARFVAKTRALFEREPDSEKRWTQLAPALNELLADPAVQAASAEWPANEFTDRAENLLFYEDPDFGFVVNGLKRETKAASPVNPNHPTWRGIHDHAHIYTLYGVLVGHEMIQRYRPVDGVERRDDFVKIEQVSDFKVEPGAVDLVRPYEIHAERSLGEQTVAIIIRSEKSGGFQQGRYDAKTGEYWQGYGPRQREVEM
jgi:predicted metal-dependent enzyme (double-stranded beta helix superfamily)